MKKKKWEKVDVLLFLLPYIVFIYIFFGAVSYFLSHAYLSYFFLSYETFRNICAGYFPFWNYRYAGGFPFFASGELNIFYFSNTINSNDVTFFWDIILHFFLSCYFYFKLLKKLELKIELSFLIIFLYITSGFSLFAIKDINYFHIYHLFPAIAYFLYLQFKKPHFKNLIIFNIFLSQIVYSNALSLAIFILAISIIILLKERQVFYSFISVTIFILLSFPFLLSLKQLLNYSDLSFYTYNFFAKNSFAPAQWTQFFYPPYSKVAFNFLVLPLIITYLIKTKFNQKWLIALGLISFLIAVGKYGFILSLIYYLKPYFIIFTNYEVFFGLFTFFIILLFAFALNYFLKTASLPLKTLRNVYLILFLIITAIYTQNFAVKQDFFYFTDAKDTFLYAISRGWHIIGIFLLINFFTIKIFLKNKYFLKILFILLFINILPLSFIFKGHYSNSIMFKSLNCKRSICSYYISKDISEEFKRVYTLNKFPEKNYPFPTMNTVYNIMLKPYFNFMKESNINSLKFASVGILESKNSTKRFTTLPMYYLTNYVIYLNNKEEVLAALKSENIKNKPVILFGKNNFISENTTNNCKGTFSAETLFLNHYTFTFNLKNNCYFVFGQTNYAGWKAYLDNKPLKIISANYLFQAVKVPDGKHILIFHFQDFSVIKGIIISCFILGLLILFFFFKIIKE